MKLTNNVETEILQLSSVGDAVRMLRAYAADGTDLSTTIQQVTYGINSKFHYKRYEDNMFTTKEKSGYVIMNGEEIRLEDLWDEIDTRIALAINALLEVVQSDDPFEGR